VLTQQSIGQLYSKHEQKKETKQTQAKKKKTKQGNLYHLIIQFFILRATSPTAGANWRAQPKKK
jgi:hypothetical protein